MPGNGSRLVLRTASVLFPVLAPSRKLYDSGMSNSSGQGVVTFEQARRIVEQHAAQVQTTRTEIMSLLEAQGRVLGEDIRADRDFPPFRRAARDGYAVRSGEVASVPVTLNVVAEIRAGAKPEDVPAQITTGQAAGIMTGAPTPEGADSIVMIEYTVRHGDRVEIARTVHPGENIVPRASEAKQGDLLLAKGTRINETAVAVIASVGKSKVQVYARPRVAVLSTGDEVIPIDEAPGPTQIRNSNSYSIASQIQTAQAEPVLLPIAPDEPGRLCELVKEGLKADLFLLAGGVSMGKYDLVEQVLAELGAEFFFTGAQIQPGKPIVFGRISSSAPKYFFGLPGNPVSTMVTFDLFVRPLLDALCGMKPRPLAFLHVRLKADIRTKTGLTRFLPGILSGEFENTEVELARWGGSGDVAATARADCYVVIPPDREHIPAGEFVAILVR